MAYGAYPDISDLNDPKVRVVLPHDRWHKTCRAFQKHGGGARCGEPATTVFLEWYDDSGDSIAVRGFCTRCSPGVGTSLSLDELEVILVLRL